MTIPLDMSWFMCCSSDSLTKDTPPTPPNEFSGSGVEEKELDEGDSGAGNGKRPSSQTDAWNAEETAESRAESAAREAESRAEAEAETFNAAKLARLRAQAEAESRAAAARKAEEAAALNADAVDEGEEGEDDPDPAEEGAAAAPADDGAKPPPKPPRRKSVVEHVAEFFTGKPTSEHTAVQV